MRTAQNEGGAWPVARLLDWTRGYFEKHGVESPRLCAEILLAHAMGCERIELYTRHNAVPGEEVLGKLRSSVREAAAGRPIAHLTGTKEFFSLQFWVTPDVLIPRPETEVLVERMIRLARHGREKIESILDVGTGSGCIAVSLAKNLPAVSVFAGDISEAALEVARRNAERHGLLERIEFRAGDLYEPWGPDCRFDAIVSNPPYVAESEAASLPVSVRDFEPGVALFAGADGLDVLRRLIAEAPQYLKPRGHLLTEVAYHQSVAVRSLLSESLWSDIVTYRDALQHERVVHARCRVSEQTQVA
jgi:release factor glutamine methyltransferase